jgi:hypothetical protein
MLPLVYYINSLHLCMRLSVTQQFYYKSILWQNRPLHFLWQNWPLYNFGDVGHGGGEAHANHRSRRHHRLLIPLVCQSVCLHLTSIYFKLPGGGGRNKDVIK